MKSKPCRLCRVIYIKKERKKEEIQAMSDMFRLKINYLLLLLYCYIVILCDYQRVMNTSESDSSYELRYIKGQNDNKNT